MSGTGNEFDDPGSNYPDRRESAGAAAESPEQRSDAGVGGAVYDESEESRPDVPGTQNEPLLEQNDASTQEQLDGIAAQTRADLGDESQDRYQEVLRQRLADSGIQISDDEVSALAQRSAPGAGGGGV